MYKRDEITQFFNQLLGPELYQDYGPNGLQIEGAQEVQKLAFAVSACAHSIAEASKLKAQGLVVHHGLFWKFHGVRTITGPFARRVKPLIQNDINLWGHHLPLDGQQEMGNAASLARKLQLNELAPFGDYKGMPTGVMGKFAAPLSPVQLRERVEKLTGRQALCSRPTTQKVQSLGIITGGANGQWLEAAREGLDAYLTGEMSEHDYHESAESGIFMIAAGHHATEKFGTLSLMQKIQENFPELECVFIDSDNPA